MKITVQEVIKLTNGSLLTNHSSSAELEINDGYVSDLLSDVMGNAKEGSVWITIMNHLNVIAVASLAGLSLVVFSKSIIPEKMVIDKANEEGICLISSSLSTFELAGRFYNLLTFS
jgi:hypothetical protein